VKLKELEKRLEKEPDNLGLRIRCAGLMREAGRSVEAVELYRSVALAYRDQGRAQQAIAVCRSILEVAPEDSACQGLLGSLQTLPGAGGATLSRPSIPPSRPSIPPSRPIPPPTEPNRRSSLDETPLPRPIPHHVMDPTSQKYRVSDRELSFPLPPGDRTPTPPPSNAVPTSQIDAAAEVETRQRPRIRTDQLAKLDEATVPGGEADDAERPSPMPRDTPVVRMSPLPRDSPAVRLTRIPIARDSDSDDLLTEPHNALSPRTSDEELTRPRERAKLFEDDD